MVKTTSKSFRFVVFAVLNLQNSRKTKHLPTLLIPLVLSDQILPLLCWSLDESTDITVRLNPMTQSEEYSMVFPSKESRPRFPEPFLWLCADQME